MSKEFVLVTLGGIGDVLVCTPAIRALREHYPDCHIITYSTSVRHTDVLVNNPCIDSVRILSPRYLLRYPVHLYAYLFNRKLLRYTSLSFQWINFYPTIIQLSAKEVVGQIFDITIRDKNIELFLTKEEERAAKQKLSPYENVVIMHIHSRTSANHHWSMKKWAALVRALPEYTFIQVGLKDEPCVEGAVDWRSKTSLREIFALLKYATSFVGVDSSVAHATNAFNVPGVVLFGDTSPVHWGHPNNVNIYKGLECSPCYQILGRDPCPFQHECMDLISVDEVKQALVRQVSSRSLVALPD